MLKWNEKSSEACYYKQLIGDLPQVPTVLGERGIVLYTDIKICMNYFLGYRVVSKTLFELSNLTYILIGKRRITSM